MLSKRPQRPNQHKPRGLLRIFSRNAQGATAIEYALLASLIAVVIVVAVTGLGGSVYALFNTTANSLQ